MRLKFLSAAFALCMSLGVAHAANIYITDLDNDKTTTYPTVAVDQCPPGVNPCITNVSNFSSDGLTFTFTSDINAALTQDAITRIFDPAWEGSALSDYVEFTTTAGSPNINVKVCSSGDVENGGSLSCMPVPTDGILFLPQDGSVETGFPQLVGQYVFVTGPLTGNEIDNFYLASEISGPEPASFTLMLLGAGLIGIGAWRRKRV